MVMVNAEQGADCKAHPAVQGAMQVMESVAISQMTYHKRDSREQMPSTKECSSKLFIEQDVRPGCCVWQSLQKPK